MNDKGTYQMTNTPHFNKNLLKYTNTASVFNIHNGAVPYFSFKLLDDTGICKNAFTTKFGGVSTGCLESLNLTSRKPGETEANIFENYRRVCAELGVDINSITLSDQTHTTNVRRITEEDIGKGLTKKRDYNDIDGLITNIPGVTLVTFYADCVPLYILDPVHKSIGLSHSGWRGTVGRMGKITIDRMHDEFGSDPAELICCIGPSICRSCFEVGGEVAVHFQEFKDVIYEHDHKLLDKGAEIEDYKKYYVDLHEANRQVFLAAGVRPEHISVTNICTHCNPDQLWSHRTTGTKRGNLGAFLSLT